jgi:glycosyltransferase involved in cell wall biosynthesis
MGVGMDRTAHPDLTGAQLGLVEDKLIYLFVFDMLSVVQRKNPYGLVEAYRRAFGPDFGETQLVIKVTKLGQYPEHAARLREAVSAVDGILLDRYLDRPDLDGLFNACDVYVSLHRSEGFGMTLAEAMCMAKPVIATDYGGNTDFMNVVNSYPVAYRLVELQQDHPPYQKGQLWADPDLDHAATQMRTVLEDYPEAQRKGQRAASDIRRWYGREAMAHKMIERLRRVVP